MVNVRAGSAAVGKSLTGRMSKASDGDQSMTRPLTGSRVCQYQPESGREKLPPLSPSTAFSSTSPFWSVAATSARSSVSSRASKLRSTALENCTMNTAPATISARALPPAAMSATRRERDLVHMPLRTRMLRCGRLRTDDRPDPIAHAAHRLDQVDAELLAQPADEHLDGVGVAVEVLIIEMLGQLGARHDLAGMVHQI